MSDIETNTGGIELSDMYAATTEDTQAAYVIEENIPIPSVINRGTLSPLRAQLESLDVGQSFLVDPEKETANIPSACKNSNQKTGMEFVRQTQADGKIRIWRTK